MTEKTPEAVASDVMGYFLGSNELFTVEEVKDLIADAVRDDRGAREADPEQEMWLVFTGPYENVTDIVSGRHRIEHLATPTRSATVVKVEPSSTGGPIGLTSKYVLDVPQEGEIR